MNVGEKYTLDWKMPHRIECEIIELAAEVMSNYADIITHPAASLRVTPSTILARHYRQTLKAHRNE